MTDSPSPLRRSTTLPTRTTPRRTRLSLGAYDLSNNRPVLSDEILYHHPFAKIVKFELPNSSSSEPVLPDLDYPVDAVETLPWKVSTERIASLGALKIEKIAGSTTFLKSGSVVYALLKNCQCWCVDNKSIFVLRIRKLTYYRIELPYDTEDDISSVENLKIALSKIIRYEITPCPFQRGFSVELPEEAKTPKKKKAWRPKAESVSEPIPWQLVVGNSDIETSVQESVDEDGNASGSSSVRGFSPAAPAKRPSSSPAPFPTVTERRIVSEPVQTFQSLVEKFEGSDSDQPPEDIQCYYDTQSPDALENSEELEGRTTLEYCSRASSFDSYHSCNSLVPSIEVFPSSPRPESPSSLHSFSDDGDDEESLIDTPQHHSRNVSDTTIGPATARLEQINSFTGRHDTKDGLFTSLNVTTDDAISCTSSDEGYATKSTATVEDPNPTIRQRLRVSRKREHSPMPPPSTLIIPAPRSPARDLRDSILQKTFTYILGPPTQFLLVMLRLAARMASQNGNSTPSNTDQAKRSSSRDSLSEDDFGIPLSPAVSSSTRYNRFTEQRNHGSSADKTD